VRKIDIPFVRLKVVAFVKQLDDVEMIFGYGEKLKIGKQRRFSRTHIGKDDTCTLHTGIGRLADGLFVLPSSRLPRLIETPTVNVINPTMVDAS
jgi:hypothetical protein